MKTHIALCSLFMFLLFMGCKGNPAPAGEPGQFAYLVTFPPGAEGNIALYTLPDMAVIGLAPSHVCGDNGLSEWLELPPGAYLLTVHADMEGRTAEIAETVIITAYSVPDTKIR